MTKSWDGDSKGEMRDLLIRSCPAPVRHAILFPGKDLLDLKLGLSKGVFNKETSFEFIERDGKVADVIQHFAKQRKLDFKLHRCKATKAQLDVWDFAFFDFCGQPTQDICEWLWDHAFPKATEGALAAFTFYTNTRNTDFLQRLCQPQNLAIYSLQAKKAFKDAYISLRCYQNAHGDTLADPDDKCVQTILASILPRGSTFKVSRGYADESNMYFALTKIAKSNLATSQTFLQRELFTKKKPAPGLNDSSSRSEGSVRAWAKIRANKAIKVLGNCSYEAAIKWIVKKYPAFADTHGVTREVFALCKKEYQA